MTFKEITSKIKNLRFTIEKVWLWELILSAAILVALLFADWQVYRNFVSQRKAPQQDAPASSLLKKNNLENAVKKIRERESFLKNPTFPVF